MNILVAIIVVISVFLLTTYLLMKYYTFTTNKRTTENQSVVFSHITKIVLLSAFPIFAVMFTFVLDSLFKLFSQKFLPDILDTLNTGIVIVSAMFFISMFFKQFYKHTVYDDYNSNLVLINYIVGCVLVIALSIFYINDINLSMSWFVILIGKFIWFDGFSPLSVIKEIKEEKSLKKLLFSILFSDVLIIALFILIIKIYELTNNDYLFYIYFGIFFGVSFSGFKIYFTEKKSQTNF